MPDAQLNLWSNIISGTVAGLVSGLLVSFTLWAINHFSKPKFEYYDIGEGAGHFFYNRYRPIIIGGSFVLGHGPALIERTPRGGYGGFYLGTMGDQVFSTTTHPDLSITLPTGETVSIAYRYAPLHYWWSQKARHKAFFQEMDPVALYTAQSKPKEVGRRDEAAGRELTKSVRGWKMAHVILKPSATKAL